MQEEKQHKGSRIGNTEWWLVVGATAMIDLAQFFLNVFAVGIVVNRFIDVIVGASLSLYFFMRGIKVDRKKVGGLLGAFIFEMFPILDTLPLWTLDVLLTMALDKADKKMAEMSNVIKIVGNIAPASSTQSNKFKKAA